MYELASQGSTGHLAGCTPGAGDTTGSFCAASPASGAVWVRVSTVVGLQGD